MFVSCSLCLCVMLALVGAQQPVRVRLARSGRALVCGRELRDAVDIFIPDDYDEASNGYVFIGLYKPSVVNAAWTLAGFAPNILGREPLKVGIVPLLRERENRDVDETSIRAVALVYVDGEAKLISNPITMIYRCLVADQDAGSAARRARALEHLRARCVELDARIKAWLDNEDSEALVGSYSLEGACTDAKRDTCVCKSVVARRLASIAATCEDFEENGVTAAKRAELAANADKAALSAECAAIPCNHGGFCGTEAMCTGVNYQIVEDNENCGEATGGQCCAPECSVGNWIRPSAPGKVVLGADVEAERASGMFCASKKEANIVYFREMGDEDGFCCMRSGCRTDAGVGKIDGLCSDEGACPGEEIGQCPYRKAQCCRASEDEIAQNLMSHEAQNNVNQDSAGFTASFKGGAGMTLQSAAAHTIGVSIAALLVAGIIVVF